MAWVIFVTLFVLWLLGVASGATLGGVVHVLLLLAVVVLLVRLVEGRAAA